MAKSKLTKAKEINVETKQIVLERQGYRSISGVYIPDIHHGEFHHVIGRGNEGIGLAFNIVALTPDEHRWYHDHADIKVNGRKRYSYLEFEILMKNHLKIEYPGWREEYCKFHKYWDEEDYWERICSGQKSKQ